MNRENENEDKGFQMKGTDGTFEYVVLVLTPKGRVGVRDLGGNFRIRVEPTEGSEAGLKKYMQKQFGWKQPGEEDQPRFSKVIEGQEKMEAAVAKVLKALGVTDEATGIEPNPHIPDWGMKLLPEALQFTKDEGFKMAGTQRTFKYVVLVLTPKGRVGVRDLGGNFRIRVEPTLGSEAGLKGFFTRELGWKQPVSQPRFSMVVRGQEKMGEVVAHVLKTLGVEDGTTDFQVNPDLPEWGMKLLTEATKPLPKQEVVPEQAAAAPVEEKVQAPKPEPEAIRNKPLESAQEIVEVVLRVARRRPVMRITTTVTVTEILL